MKKKWEQRVVSHVLKRKVKALMIWYERDWSIQVMINTSSPEFEKVIDTRQKTEIIY